MINSAELRAGDWVEIRSKAEILSTLDEKGELEGLPFMPEMFEFCGKKIRVFKRAHKTCDPPNGLGGRRMLRTVHLDEVRCNGDAHGGCQARCLVFWKEAWLKKVSGRGECGTKTGGDVLPSIGCSEQAVRAATQRQNHSANPSDEPLFACQSTELSRATQPLSGWDIRQYIEDYFSGNVRFSQILAAFLFFVYEELVTAGLGLGAALRWLYDVVQRIRGGTPYPWRVGLIDQGAKTPAAKLDVQSGELVKIRSYPEILKTLNVQRQNRGMWFDAEMVPYCGGTYRVLDRISKIINEKTGKMQHLKNDCIMLDEVVCRACYATNRRFCPRGIYAYWREIWLERISPGSSANVNQELEKSANQESAPLNVGK